MANEKTMKPKADKAVKDLRAAEIVYYSIGGIVLLTGLVFSIFGVILLNPITPNFEGSLLLEAQTAFFQWLKINTTFEKAGFVLMALAIIYFLITFSIFSKKGDEVLKKVNLKKSRQRQVVFQAPVNNEVNEENKVL
jgi:hypothetical protein